MSKPSFTYFTDEDTTYLVNNQIVLRTNYDTDGHTGANRLDKLFRATAKALGCKVIERHPCQSGDELVHAWDDGTCCHCDTERDSDDA